MSAIAWMVAPPTPPKEWPSSRVRTHSIVTAEDEGEYSYQLTPRGRTAEREGYQAALARAAEVLTPPNRDRFPSEDPAVRRRQREEEAAARGETFAPLEPGQKRRRRIRLDGTPARLKRGEGQRLQAQRAAEPITYRGPVRAPGEMTYGQAARLIRRANDGELVDLQDLCRAHDVVREARRLQAEADAAVA